MKKLCLTLLSSGLLFAACSTPPPTVPLHPQLPSATDTAPVAREEDRKSVV